MFDSQYYKVWRDMTQNKGRSALVVLSIVLGVFAIGLTMGSRTMLTDGMSGSYLAANPAEFTIGTSELVGDDFINAHVDHHLPIFFGIHSPWDDEEPHFMNLIYNVFLEPTKVRTHCICFCAFYFGFNLFPALSPNKK